MNGIVENKHILILPSWYPKSNKDIYGGFFREHAISLSDYGFDVGVIYPTLHSLKELKIYNLIDSGIHYENDNGVRTLRYIGSSWIPKRFHLNRYLELYHGIKLFKYYVKRFGEPDIIHVQSMLNAAILAEYIKKRYKIPYIISEHSWIYGTGRLKTKELQIVKTASKNAAFLSGVSISLCTELQSLINNECIWNYIPNMVCDEFFISPLKKTKSKQFRFVCIASSLDDNKSVSLIVKALDKLSKKFKNVLLEIIGDGPNRNKIENLTKKLGLNDRVMIHGTQKKKLIIEILKKSDSLILASKYETFGVVIIEALAMGKPVIATKCGGPESIIEEEDGILIPINNVNAMAEAMSRIIINYDRYNPYQIRKRCKDRYSVNTVLGDWSKVYNGILKM